MRLKELVATLDSLTDTHGLSGDEWVYIRHYHVYQRDDDSTTERVSLIEYNPLSEEVIIE